MFEICNINLAKILDKFYTLVREDRESLEKLFYLLIYLFFYLFVGSISPVG